MILASVAQRLAAGPKGRSSTLLLHRPFLLGHVEHQIDHSIRIPPLVVVPAYDLEEVRIQFDARSGVEDRAARIPQKIRRDHLFIPLSDNALHLTFPRRLHPPS